MEEMEEPHLTTHERIILEQQQFIDEIFKSYSRERELNNNYRQDIARLKKKISKLEKLLYSFN